MCSLPSRAGSCANSAIGPLLRIGYLNVRRDRVVLAMVFVLPVMFSIFATVFGNQRDSTTQINVAVADLDQSDYSRRSSPRWRPRVD
jgi:hypothetical protein